MSNAVVYTWHIRLNSEFILNHISPELMTRILHKSDCDNSFAISNERLRRWNREMSSMDLIHSGLTFRSSNKVANGIATIG